MSLDQALRTGLNQDSQEAESDDGCDAAMVRIDAVHRVLEFAGAKLGLLHLKPDGTVDRISPSRVSLGYQQPPREAPLLKRIAYEPGSMVVMVSDGFTDQIGGDAGAPRAYGYRRLTELLQSSRGESATVIAARMKDRPTSNSQSGSERNDPELASSEEASSVHAALAAPMPRGSEWRFGRYTEMGIALLGLVNVRGELVLCIALDKILGLARATTKPNEHTVYERLLVAAAESRRIA